MRKRIVIPALAALAIVGVAVASDDTPETATTVPTPSAVPSPSPGPAPSDLAKVDTGRFASAFTGLYPNLADGPSGTSLASAAENTCLDLRQNTERAVLIKRTIGRFERPSVTVDDAKAVEIIDLARSTSCPDAPALAAPPKPVAKPKAVAPTTAPKPKPKAAYYANCTAARAAGAAPLYRGSPGYRSGLDQDGDGVACE